MADEPPKATLRERYVLATKAAINAGSRARCRAGLFRQAHDIPVILTDDSAPRCTDGVTPLI